MEEGEDQAILGPEPVEGPLQLAREVVGVGQPGAVVARSSAASTRPGRRARAPGRSGNGWRRSPAARGGAAARSRSPRTPGGAGRRSPASRPRRPAGGPSSGSRGRRPPPGTARSAGEAPADRRTGAPRPTRGRPSVSRLRPRSRATDTAPSTGDTPPRGPVSSIRRAITPVIISHRRSPRSTNADNGRRRPRRDCRGRRRWPARIRIGATGRDQRHSRTVRTVRSTPRPSAPRNARPWRSRPALSRSAISWSSGESIRQAISASSVGVTSARSLPAAIELGLEPEHGLEHLGVGLRRAAHQEALLAGAEALLVVVAVEAEPDDRGAEPARSAVGLRRHRHLEEGLSRVVAVEGRGGRPGSQSPAAARLATRFLSASRPRSNSAPGDDSDRRREARPATFLRPAQAFLGGRSRHPVGRPDRDRPRLDLLLAEEPRLRSSAVPAEADRQRHAGRGTGGTSAEGRSPAVGCSATGLTPAFKSRIDWPTPQTIEIGPP